MKKFTLSLFTITFFSTASLAQYSQVQKPIEKVVIKTPTILCEKCQEKVEFFVGKSAGVTAVSVNIRKHTTTVTYITDRTRPEQIRAEIANLGYAADDYEPDEIAFKRLPKECKADIAAAKEKAARAAALNPAVKPQASGQ